MAEYVPREVEAVAEAIYRVDAPRYGNETYPWREVTGAQRTLLLEQARAAIRCYTELKLAEPPAEPRP